MHSRVDGAVNMTGEKTQVPVRQRERLQMYLSSQFFDSSTESFSGCDAQVILADLTQREHTHLSMKVFTAGRTESKKLVNGTEEEVSKAQITSARHGKGTSANRAPQNLYSLSDPQGLHSIMRNPFPNTRNPFPS